MLRRFLIQIFRRPAGSLRKLSSLSTTTATTTNNNQLSSLSTTTNTNNNRRFNYKVYLAAAAAPLALTGYAAFGYDVDLTGYGKLDIKETDLASDEAVWALYGRWCRHHNIQRTKEDKRRRFDYFKWHAKHVYQINHLGLGYTIALTRFSDQTHMEDMKGTSSTFPNWVEDIKALEAEAPPSGDACAICCQHFSSNHPSVVMGCKHEFHPLCMFKWRLISSKCRLCWQPLTLKDPTSEKFEEEEGKILWVLYETWCGNQGLYKTPADMKKGFKKLRSTLQGYANWRDKRLSNKAKAAKRGHLIEEEDEEEED